MRALDELRQRAKFRKEPDGLPTKPTKAPFDGFVGTRVGVSEKLDAGLLPPGLRPAPAGWLDMDHAAMLAELDALLPNWCERFGQDLNAAQAFRRRTSVERCWQWLAAIRSDLEAV